MTEDRDPLSSFFEAFDPGRLADTMQAMRRQMESALRGVAPATPAPGAEAMAQAREQLAALEGQWREAMRGETERIAQRLRAMSGMWGATPFGAMAGAAADAIDRELERQRARALETLGIASRADLDALAARVEALEKRRADT